ncbi:MAG: dihydrofolate reductase [Clostridiales bacterium]|nr:dihydrofolate reductase [Clostridiales bacterium]
MNLIVSVSSDWAIGFKNDLLFHVREDMKYFKAMTTGNIVVMGQNTFFSLPGQKPLKDRINYIISDDPTLSVEGAFVVHSLDELFEELKKYDTDKVFVIGGAMIYKTLLPYCENAYITQFNSSKEADRFFPRLDESDEWRLASRSELFETDGGLTFTFDKYERIK